MCVCERAYVREIRPVTCRMTLSGWLKLGELERVLLPGVAGHRPSSFLPHVRMLGETQDDGHPTDTHAQTHRAS